MAKVCSHWVQTEKKLEFWMIMVWFLNHWNQDFSDVNIILNIAMAYFNNQHLQRPCIDNGEVVFHTINTYYGWTQTIVHIMIALDNFMALILAMGGSIMLICCYSAFQVACLHWQKVNANWNAMWPLKFDWPIQN